MAKNEPKVYHHSSVKGTVLKIAIISAAIVLILALTAFFGFRKYISYTDTGKLYLDIPWLYGYMDGVPETDDLAPYLEPVKIETKNNISDTGGTGDNTPVSADNVGSDTDAFSDNINLP